MGNLTSQFFANVYLNALDQFVKHTLKVRHYVRYVDDFVLLADTPAQLAHWQQEIDTFLHQTLRLRGAPPLHPCHQDVDFLGYVVCAHHRRVRLRVVQHCRANLHRWQHQQHQNFAKVRLADVQQLQALLGSHWGHFAHTNSVRLRQQLLAQMPWLATYVRLNADSSLHHHTPACWQVLRRRAVQHILKPEGDHP